MTTNFTDVFDLFMMLQTDYRLITLYNSSVPNFNTYLTGFLVLAVDEFKVCDQDLSYTLSTKLFTETLSQKNITILAQLVKKNWLEKSINNISQMEGKIQDSDFKFYSEANNYKERKDGLILELEKVSQKLVEYGYNNQSNWDILNAINL